MDAPLIQGIDAGNTRMKMAVCDPQGNPTLLHNDRGEPYTPSVVYFAPEGGTLVGTDAVNAGFADPKRVVSDWKRHMGTDAVLYEDDSGKQYRAEDILEILLRHSRACFFNRMGKEPEDVVVSVPANYTDPQKAATLEAAKNSGLNVLKLVHEPTAAALGNGVHKRQANRLVVYDLGGGTFDVSVVGVLGSEVNVVATGGESHLGGKDFNDRIMERLLQTFEADQGFRPEKDKHPLFYMEASVRIEQAKVTLTLRPQTQLVVSCDGHLCNMALTRDEFEEATKDLIETTMDRLEQTVKDSGHAMSETDEILLVGGASRMPIVARRIEERFGKKPATCVEPDYAAAFGNVVACRLERERQGRPLVSGNVALPPLDRRYQDVTAHAIGVCVLTEDERQVNCVLLTKGVPMPSQQVRLFRLVEPNQTDALIEVLQGADHVARDKCVLLGHFEIRDLPPQPDTDPRIEIRLKIDSNGMLTATARDMLSGKTAELVLDYKNHKGQTPEADKEEGA